MKAPYKLAKKIITLKGLMSFLFVNRKLLNLSKGNKTQK